MDQWLADEREAAGLCPACSQDAAPPVVRGMRNQLDVARLDGVVEFAGCCTPEHPRRFVCGECGAQWGRPAWARGPEPADGRAG